MRALGICGSGGSGRELRDLVDRINDIENRWDEVVYVDKAVDDSAHAICGEKVYTFEETAEIYGIDEIEYTISVGDVYLREKIYKQIKSAGYNLATIVAPGVHIPASTHLGEGVIVRDYSYISVDVIIQDNAMIQPNTAIGHDVIVGENSIVSAQSSVAGGTQIGRNTYIALNCAVKELVTIGSDSIVAMGSVVNKDIGDKVIAGGNPVEIISKNYLRSAFRLNTGGR